MHKTVLLKEAVEALNIEEGDVVVDATLGAGGHTKQLAKKVGSDGRVIAFDVDPEAINQVKKTIDKELINRIKFVNDNFSNIEVILESGESRFRPDAILADLGWRIEQIEDEKYGLSFNREAPLDMRLGNTEGGKTAYEIVNFSQKQDLAEIFKKLGGEKHGTLLASAICKKRKQEKIEKTTQLAALAREVLGRFYQKSKIHPATKIFQALRIAVNNELENLEIFLGNSIGALRKNGRLAVISFHSAEDKIVKNFFRDAAKGCDCPRDCPRCICGKLPKVRLVTRKPIVPSEEEIEHNNRSRSAKMRVVEKI